jgi:hypothetical protein
MIIDLIAQTAPPVWALVAGLLLVALAIVSYIDPEWVEVYVGEPRVVVGMVAVAAVVLALVVAPTTGGH